MVNKIMFTFFISLFAVFPAIGYLTSPSFSSLVSSEALTLAGSLAYLLVYLLQILPSLTKGETYELLSTLPLSDRDFSLVAMLSVVRTFDYLLIGATATQVAVMFLLTR